jgi:anti-sigma B factor antagonist
LSDEFFHLRELAMSRAPSEFIAIERREETLVAVLCQGGSSLVGPQFEADRAVLLERIHYPDVRGVVFDLANADYFGSLLLDTLCLAWKHARECGAGMALCNVSSFGQEILRKAKLNMLWPTYPSRDEAVESLRRASGQPAGGSQSVPRVPPSRRTDLSSRLQVMQTEPIVVIGFGGHDLPPEHALGGYLGAIGELIEQTGCRELAFEMEGVVMVPSGFLGVIASITKRGVAVTVRHPSKDVREVLELTHFDQIIKLDPPSPLPE